MTAPAVVLVMVILEIRRDQTVFYAVMREWLSRQPGAWEPSQKARVTESP